MFKDYYLILGVKQDASFEAIRAAYELKSKGWHPDCDVTNKLLDVNEAYVILKDAAKRQRYDKEYVRYRVLNDAWRTEEYVMQDEILQEDIKQARQSAHALVSEFMLSYYKKASRESRPGCGTAVFYLLIVTILLAVIKLALGTLVEDKANVVQHSEVASEPTSQSVDVSSSSAAWQTPTSWKRYELGNGACSIAVPSTVTSDATYAKQLKAKSASYGVNADFAVFQRPGVVHGESYEDYCFITVVYIAGKAGEFLSAQEMDPLDQNTKAALRNMIQQELHPYCVIGEPTCRWIDLQGIKALEVKCRGRDQENIMVGTMYFLNNYSEMVRVAILYSANAKSSLSSDWNNVIRTFRWE